MTLLQILVLASIQGLTEFLPISSSAHLILVPVLSDWPDQGLAFDVAVHVGTLGAVMFYFRHDIVQLASAWSLSLLKQQHSAQSRLAWGVIVASIPLALGGLLLHDWVDTVFRSPLVIAGATIGFGILLGVADMVGRRQQQLTQMSWLVMILVGISQVFALIPGTSRSGATMTAGLLLGLTRQAAARFSFLLSIPAIIMAGGYQGMKLLDAPQVDWSAITFGVLFSALTAYLCIHLFLKLLDRIGMWPFVVYRLLLGGILLYIFL